MISSTQIKDNFFKVVNFTKDPDCINFFTDPHFAANPPPSRIDDYFTSIKNKLSEIEVPPNCLNICAGDLFHYVSPYRNANEFVFALAMFFQSKFGNLYSIIGNHDFYKSYLNLDAYAIQGFVGKGVNFFAALDYPSLTVVGIPYMTDELQESFDQVYPMEEVLAVLKKKSGVPVIFIIHNYVKTSFPGQHLIKTEFLKKFADSGIVLIGHAHEVVDKSFDIDGFTFFQVGSVSRRTVSYDDTQRTPCYLKILPSPPMKFERIEFKNVLPWDKVISTRRIVDQYINQDIKEFVDTLGEVKGQDYIDKLTEKIYELAKDPAVLKVLVRALSEHGFILS